MVNHYNDIDLRITLKSIEMEVIAIEGKTFELIKDQFETFAKQIKQWCGTEQQNNTWLDNQNVCNLLNISKRALQYYHNSGKISFSHVNSKCYYKVSDVEKLLKDSQTTKIKENENIRFEGFDWKQGERKPESDCYYLSGRSTLYVECNPYK